MADDQGAQSGGREASSRKPSGLASGTVLNSTHRIDALLARGGMGEVYRATNLATGDQVAVKAMRAEYFDDTKLKELFRREGSVLRKLRHPAVVYYEGTFLDESGQLYLVMELVEGPSLATVANGQPLPVEAVRRLRDRIAGGLAAAHEAGLVHRDVSPDNVILPGGKVEDAKLIDFGIAKQLATAQTTLIGDSFAGKLTYASPEQFGLYGGHVDGRSDIYSLGLVLAYAAAGRAPDMGSSLATAITARQTVPDLAQVPPELREEIARLLVPDPALRPRSLTAPPLAPAPIPAGLPRAKPAPRRKRAAIAAGVFSLAALAGAWFLTPTMQEPASQRAPALDDTREAPAPAPTLAPPPAPAPPPTTPAPAVRPAPADAIAAASPTAITAATPAGTRFRDCSGCPEMIVIPGGRFMMGTPAGEAGRAASEGPQTPVSIPPFALSIHPVTRGEWQVCATENRCPPHTVTAAGTSPVGNVTLRAVQEYLAWLSGRAGVTYRLPSEAEWEYAARAGTTTAYWWGDEIGRGNANCAGCGSAWDNRGPAPVGSFRPNAFGLHDMLGNIFEWVADCAHQDGYAQRPTDARAWGSENGGDCSRTTMRGGAWNSPPAALRAGARASNESNIPLPFVGFRVARPLAP